MCTFKTYFDHIPETNCYCSGQAASAVRLFLEDFPLEAVHLIGTGDYHYASLFFLERIREPFRLVLFDKHSDSQESELAPDMLNCGNWVAAAERSLPVMKDRVWVNGAVMPGIPDDGLPVYLSVDLDLLSEDYAVTDWDQGDVTLSELSAMISELCRTKRIIGADICGGISISKGAKDSDLALNAATTNQIAMLIDEAWKVSSLNSKPLNSSCTVKP